MGAVDVVAAVLINDTRLVVLQKMRTIIHPERIKTIEAAVATTWTCATIEVPGDKVKNAEAPQWQQAVVALAVLQTRPDPGRAMVAR